MDGFVAFLDILGFSKLITSHGFTEQFDQYTKIIDEELRTDDNIFSYITFSDSLIIHTVSIVDEQLLRLADAVSRIFYRLLIEMDLPLCGCISGGSYYRMKSKGNIMIAGEPFLDAVEYEKLQDWVGIMISPKVLKIVPKLPMYTFLSDISDPITALTFFNWSSVIRRCPNIPLKGHFDGYSILPRTSNSQTVNQYLKDIADFGFALDKLKLSAPNVHTQNKYNNTSHFLEEIYNSWKKYLGKQNWKDAIEALGDIDHFDARAIREYMDSTRPEANTS